MSWQRSATGDERQIREQIGGWAGSIGADDVARKATANETKGNAAQVAVAQKAVELVLTEFEGKRVSVQASGHSSESGGSVTVTYSMLDTVTNPIEPARTNNPTPPTIDSQRAPSPPSAAGGSKQTSK